MPDKDVQAELVAVPGIGLWSAQMVMMRCIRRPDIFPAGDLGIRAALTTLDKLGTRITRKAAEQRGQVWRPYRSYATSHLWGFIWAMESPRSELGAAPGMFPAARGSTLLRGQRSPLHRAGGPGTSWCQAPGAARPRPARRRRDPNPTIGFVRVM
jgi:hypothetical protein